MNREVIQYSIERLQEIDARGLQFDMDMWGNKADSHPLSEPEQAECGFAGCFMGWAAHQQWFDPFGLKLRLYDDNGRRTPHLKIDGSSGTSEHTVACTCVADLFDITTAALNCIILPDKYVGFESGSDIEPRHVIERLQFLLSTDDDETFVKRIYEELDNAHDDEEDEDE